MAADVVSELGPFHVHLRHAFDGFEIVGRLLVARCACGDVLDVADPEFAACHECEGEGACLRCGGSGLVVDHAALEWRLPTASEAFVARP